MPLLSVKNTGKSGICGLWHLNESLDELLEKRPVLANENHIFSTIQAIHKKKEWLAARILSAILLKEERVQIRHDAWSKPHFMFIKKHLSVTHSHDLLAVQIDDHPTGTDIEKLKPVVSRIREKFLSDEELLNIKKENELDVLTLYWCTKESLYKVYGKKELRFKEHLRVEPFDLSRDKKISASIEHPLFRKKFELDFEKIKNEEGAFYWTRVIQ